MEGASHGWRSVVAGSVPVLITSLGHNGSLITLCRVGCKSQMEFWLAGRASVNGPIEPAAQPPLLAWIPISPPRQRDTGLCVADQR